MRLQRHRHLLGGVILLAGCTMALSGCLGFGGGSSNSTPSTLRHVQVVTTAGSTNESLADASGQPIVVSPADEYSSFQSKDPFVQQQVSTTTEPDTSSATTTPAATTTTTTTPTSTSTTTTSSTSTTSTSTSSSTTSTTSFYTHMLQVLTVGDVNGTPAVTFQVDNNVGVEIPSHP